MFDFRFNTPNPFPESGSRKRFHASGMRGIDFSHKITPRNVFFTKIHFFKKFGQKHEGDPHDFFHLSNISEAQCPRPQRSYGPGFLSHCTMESPLFFEVQRR